MIADELQNEQEQEQRFELEGIGEAPRKGSLRKKLMLTGGGALIVLAVGGFLFASQGSVSTDDAQVDGHISPVAAKIAGNVTDVLVDANQAVKAGQVLVRLDARDYQVKVDQARAALNLAISQARAAGAGVPLTEATTSSGVSGAQAQVARAEAELSRAQAAYQQASSSDIAYAQANYEAKKAANDRAQADVTRMRPLAAKEEISAQQFDAYVAVARVAKSEMEAAAQRLEAAKQNAEAQRAALLAAQAQVAQAKASLASSKANQQQVTVQSAQAASATAAVEQARANLEAAQLQLSYTTIVAPVDGIVTRKTVEVGQVIQPGQGLMAIIPTNDIWITANFKETQLARVSPGQKAEVKLDLNGKRYEGYVESIANATGARMSLLPPENATGNYVKVVERIPVRIRLNHLPQDQRIFRPGMNVEAKIFTR
jgi:membrane fusion protein (multidrug efflux system)